MSHGAPKAPPCARRLFRKLPTGWCSRALSSLSLTGLCLQDSPGPQDPVLKGWLSAGGLEWGALRATQRQEARAA